jgi:hypothetical protein
MMCEMATFLSQVSHPGVDQYVRMRILFGELQQLVLELTMPSQPLPASAPPAVACKGSATVLTEVCHKTHTATVVTSCLHEHRLKTTKHMPASS